MEHLACSPHSIHWPWSLKSSCQQSPSSRSSLSLLGGVTGQSKKDLCSSFVLVFSLVDRVGERERLLLAGEKTEDIRNTKQSTDVFRKQTGLSSHVDVRWSSNFRLTIKKFRVTRWRFTEKVMQNGDCEASTLWSKSDNVLESDFRGCLFFSWLLC